MTTDLQQIEAAGFKAIFLTVDNPNEEGVRTRARRADGPDSRLAHLICLTSSIVTERYIWISGTHALTFDVRVRSL